MGRKRMRDRLVAVCAGLAVVALVAGCGVAKDTPSLDGGSSQTQAGGGADNEKLADSLSAFISQSLDQAEEAAADANNQTPPSQFQLDVLKRAKENGSMSQADYEQMWSNFKQCVVAKGQPEPKLIKYANGMYEQASVSGSDAKVNAFRTAAADCEATELIYAESIYGYQLDNPNMYADPRTGLIDCLHRHGLAPKDYTAEQYEKDAPKGPDSLPFDWKNPDVRSCMVANGATLGDATDPTQNQDLGQ